MHHRPFNSKLPNTWTVLWVTVFIDESTPRSTQVEGCYYRNDPYMVREAFLPDLMFDWVRLSRLVEISDEDLTLPETRDSRRVIQSNGYAGWHSRSETVLSISLRAWGRWKVIVRDKWWDRSVPVRGFIACVVSGIGPRCFVVSSEVYITEMRITWSLNEWWGKTLAYFAVWEGLPVPQYHYDPQCPRHHHHSIPYGVCFALGVCGRLVYLQATGQLHRQCSSEERDYVLCRRRLRGRLPSVCLGVQGHDLASSPKDRYNLRPTHGTFHDNREHARGRANFHRCWVRWRVIYKRDTWKP